MAASYIVRVLSLDSATGARTVVHEVTKGTRGKARDAYDLFAEVFATRPGHSVEAFRVSPVDFAATEEEEENQGAPAATGEAATAANAAPPRPAFSDENVAALLAESGADGVSSSVIVSRFGVDVKKVREALGRLREAGKAHSVGQTKNTRWLAGPEPKPEPKRRGGKS
jgi:hypothetical protein